MSSSEPASGLGNSAGVGKSPIPVAETPTDAAAGGIQFGPSDEFLINAAQAEPIEGMLDVAVHGTPHTIEIGSLTVDHEALAALIEGNSQYTGQAIRLISCETGSIENGIAQNLANELGVEVLAPDDLIWAWANGDLVIGPSPHANTGSWRLFKPTSYSR